MKSLNSYAKEIKLLYANKLVDVVDCNNQFHYISKKLSTMLGLNVNDRLANFDDINIESNDLIQRVKELNKTTLDGDTPVKFISMGKLYHGEFYVFRGVKYPLFNELNKPIGVFTLINMITAIHINLEKTAAFNQIVFNLNGYNFNELEQLILFYASIGFTQSEIYGASVVNGRKLSLNGFKYHYNQLLVRHKVSSITEIINEVDALRTKSYIPQALLESNHCEILL